MNKREAKIWLRELRAAAKKTQADVADQLEVSTRTIQNMENPKYGFPNGYTMLRYLDAIGAIQAPTEAPPPESEEAFLERVEALTLEVRRRLRPAPEIPPDEEQAAGEVQ